MRARRTAAVCCFGVLATATTRAADPPATAVRAAVDAVYADVDRLYVELHQSPELSLQEEKTAATLADRLRRLGYEVTTGIGGHGLVGVLKNGPGPTLMIRTDLDGLPVEEATGLPYASRVRVKDPAGVEVPVMHACGHDVHMAAWIGTAAILAAKRDLWRGTVLLVGQPAEERLLGARAMLADGLFERFPKPTFALAIHDSANMPAGAVGIVPGYFLAASDAVDLTIFGKGGHGAYPHTTVDPIVIAARTVLALQTLVAREKDPFEPAVVTVGSIHGGTKHNIIPDEVRLQLTVRSYQPQVRERILAGIERIAAAEAAAASAAKPPVVKIGESAKATYNDPALAERLAARLRRDLGEPNVLRPRPEMGAEDFSEFVAAGVPGVMLWVGAVEPARFEAAKAGGETLPSLHSSSYAPDRERTLRTAVLAETLAALELLRRD